MWDARVLFSPVVWVVLWFFVVFLVVPMILPLFDYPILGLENQSISFRFNAALHAQGYLCYFLLCFAAGFVLTSPSADRTRSTLKFQHFPAIASPFLIVGALLGAVALAYLLQHAGDGPRSHLVKTLPGQLAYAFSFVLSYVVVVATVGLLRRHRYLAALALISMFGIAVLLLGGRGRALWPFVHVFVFLAIVQNRRISISLLFWFLAGFFVVLQFLDPFLWWARSQVDTSALLGRYHAALVVTQLFLARTFDGFHNFALITSIDRVPQDLFSIFRDPSHTLFMPTYFPKVIAGGVGYPATLPGELWFAGRELGLVIGGFLWGCIFGLIQRAYWAIRRESALWAYVILIPWISALHLSYFGQFAKVFAAAAAAITIFVLDWVFNRVRTNRSGHLAMSST